MSPDPPIPIPQVLGLPPGSHPTSPRRVGLWVPACEQSSAPPTRLTTAPHGRILGVLRRGPGGVQPSHGHSVGWGALQCWSQGGDGVGAPCPAHPGRVGLPPTAGSQQSSASGQGQPPGPPQLRAASWAPSHTPSFLPTPALALSSPPSMFKENFPNGCFYFIACNKGKRPTPLGSALPWAGAGHSPDPPQPHCPGQQLLPSTQWAGDRQLPTTLRIPGWEQAQQSPPQPLTQGLCPSWGVPRGALPHGCPCLGPPRPDPGCRLAAGPGGGRRRRGPGMGRDDGVGTTGVGGEG